MKNFCPNCNSEIKESIIASVTLSSNRITEFINEFTDNQSSRFCTKCYRPILERAVDSFYEIKKESNEVVDSTLKSIPIITIHSPKDWDYDVLEMITSQSVTGTGLFSEIASDWTDFFGKESNSYNKKLKEGEERCKNQLRIEAFRIGANAIIAADIDYSEAGGSKGMLMVCISGTAIKLKNIEILGKGKDWPNILQIALETLQKLSSYDLYQIKNS